MRVTERMARLEQKRAALLDALAGMDPAVLAARPATDKWSILEIVEHMVIAEEYVLVDLGNLDRLEERRRSARHRFWYPIVMFVLRYDVPVKVPSRAMIPTGERSLGELRDRWEANHGQLRDYVTRAGRDGERRAVFRHPVAGPLSMAQAVRMLEVHLDRHAGQIHRLERARGSQTRS